MVFNEISLLQAFIDESNRLNIIHIIYNTALNFERHWRSAVSFVLGDMDG